MDNPNNSIEQSRLLSEDRTLYKRTVSSGGWVLIARVVQQLMAMCRLLVLARFLFPKDFGLLGIALLSLSIIRIFTETGFHEALIQKKEVTDKYLNVVWTIGIIRGLVLYLFLFFLAPFVTVFFDDSTFKELVRPFESIYQ